MAPASSGAGLRTSERYLMAPETLLTVIFFVVAIGLFILAGFAMPRGTPPNVHLGWFGLASLTIGLWIQLL